MKAILKREMYILSFMAMPIAVCIVIAIVIALVYGYAHLVDEFAIVMCGYFCGLALSGFTNLVRR